MFKKLGIQLYTVRDFMHNADDIRATFKKLKAIGYDQAQTAGCDIPYEEFGKIAKEEGIEIVGTHDDFDMMRNDPEQSMKNHRALGTTNMGIGGVPGEFFESTAKINEFCEIANKIGDTIAPHGFKFTYHNHSGEFRKYDGITMMERLVKGTNPDTVSFVLDTYWVQHGGGDVRHWIEMLAGRIDILHLKDMKYGPEIAEIGAGNLYWDEILKLAEATGVKSLVVEQDCNWENGDPFLSAKMSADYLAKYLDK